MISAFIKSGRKYLLKNLTDFFFRNNILQFKTVSKIFHSQILDNFVLYFIEHRNRDREEK